MPLKYKIDLKEFHAKADKAMEELAKMIVEDSKPYLPYRSGGLERSVRITNNNRTIIYDKPYARFLWRGKLMLADNGSSWAKRGQHKHATNTDLNFYTGIHQKAGARWISRSKQDNMVKWKERIKEILKG